MCSSQHWLRTDKNKITKEREGLYIQQLEHQIREAFTFPIGVDKFKDLFKRPRNKWHETYTDAGDQVVVGDHRFHETGSIGKHIKWNISI